MLLANTNKNRIFEADFLRGVAIIMMVVFHFCFDLNYFKYISIDIYNGIEWKAFRVVIVSIFLSIVGASMVFAYGDGVDIKKFKKRVLMLLVSALLITIVTKIIFPYSWIYFGIIHFVLLATLVGVFFVRIPTISLFLGVAILAGFFAGYLSTEWVYDFFKPLLDLPYRTEDIVRFFPWFGVVLIGIFLGYYRFFGFKIAQNGLSKKVAFLGRHSLFIYLAHQPVLFGSMMLVANLS